MSLVRKDERSVIRGFLGCMDHSITEQLTGKPSAWHTTAIALSEGGEISTLCNDIVGRLGGHVTKLRKWKRGSRGNYRRRFAEALVELLPRSAVSLFAISAHEHAIVAASAQIRSELGLDALYRQYRTDTGQQRIKLGPVTQVRTGEQDWFDIPEAQAIMLLWIAHFMLRCHRHVYEIVQHGSPRAAAVDWFFYMDKLVATDSTAELFNFVLQHNLGNRLMSVGNIRLASFNDSDTIDTDLLADNLAGLLNGIAEGKMPIEILNFLRATGRIHFEYAASGYNSAALPEGAQ